MGHGCGCCWDYQRRCERFVFRLVFRSCLWRADTDQNRWAEVFSLPSPLLWVNTCLQVTVQGALTNTKSQFISRDGMLLPSLCRIHGKVLSRGPSGFVIQLFLLSLHPSPLNHNNKIIRYLFQVPNNIKSRRLKQMHFWKTATSKYHISSRTTEISRVLERMPPPCVSFVQNLKNK